MDIEDIRKIVAGYKPRAGRKVTPLLQPWEGTLTPRERFRRVMNYQPFDRLPNQEFGYWNEVYPVWQSQGMSKAVTDEGRANQYFAFDQSLCLGGNYALSPSFPERVISREADGRKVFVDGDGVTQEVFEDNMSSIPHFLDWSLKTPADWPRFKERLNPKDKTRVPKGWKKWLKKNRTVPAGVWFGSLPGIVRNWMGFEGICYAVHDYPEMMEEIFNHLTDVIVTVLEQFLPGTDFDFAMGWEDISFRSGPILSPAYFKSVIVPCYKRITKVLRKHGVEIVYTDSDGDISLLIEPWLEGGINTLFPVERFNATDPVLVRKKFGKQVRMIGGVDKKALIDGPEAIKRELDYLAPIVAEGGFIPHVDHRVPPNVSYQNYLVYLDLKRKMFGTPKPC